MKRNETLDLNDCNLYQLARVVSQTPKDIKHTWSKIQQAYEWAGSFVAQADSKMLQGSLRSSIQVSIIAAREMSLAPSMVIAAIVAPLFLKGLVEKETIQRRFGLKVVSILVELDRLKCYKLPCGAMRNCRNAPDVAVPRILAIFLQICDIIRLSYRGVLLESFNSSLIYYSSNKLLLDLKCFYIPFSHRMRLYNIQAQLADFWLKHTDALSYYSITSKLGMTKLQREQKLNLISEEVYSAVQAHGIDCVLKKRIKSIYSIWHKIQRLNLNVDQIYDLYAIRIILTGMDRKTLQEEKITCWRVLSILSGLYNPICNMMRDWVSIPRDSSYESLHLVFDTHKHGRLEIQIRTERMDYIAEHGQAAHWKYKL